MCLPCIKWRFDSVQPLHIETIGLIPKISVLFSFLGVIACFRHILLKFLRRSLFFFVIFICDQQWKKRLMIRKTIAKTFRFFYWFDGLGPLAMMLEVFFYDLKNFYNFFWKYPRQNASRISIWWARDNTPCLEIIRRCSYETQIKDQCCQWIS